MNNRQINRTLSIWLDFPAASTGTLAGVLSYSSQTEGVRFHSFRELIGLLQRLGNRSAGAESSTTMLKLAS